MRVTINGLFVTMRMQGVVRYATELVRALDEVLEEGDDVELVVPRSADNVPQLVSIPVVKVGHLTGKPWEQVDLAAYMLFHRDRVLLNLCNVAPIVARPGVTAIHDVMYKARPEYYTTLRNRVSRLWHCSQYALLTRRELSIITVSEFSKGEIERYYPASVGKIRVVPNAWQHVLGYKEAPDWRERYPELVPGEYLFSMATLARNKNGRWVYEVAKRNPGITFAIAGKRYESDGVSIPENVHLLGYISDEDACALIRNCRAFLFPSLYEGFGLPPLEALGLGAKVIASHETSLPEVLGNSAHYVDPNEFAVNLDEMLSNPHAEEGEALVKYSWESSSSLLHHCMKQLPTIKQCNC